MTPSDATFSMGARRGLTPSYDRPNVGAGPSLKRVSLDRFVARPGDLAAKRRVDWDRGGRPLWEPLIEPACLGEREPWHPQGGTTTRCQRGKQMELSADEEKKSEF